MNNEIEFKGDNLYAFNIGQKSRDKEIDRLKLQLKHSEEMCIELQQYNAELIDLYNEKCKKHCND